MAVVSARRNPLASGSKVAASLWHHVDVALIGATLAIASLGVLMVYSATRSVIDTPTTFLVRQFAFLVIGLVVMTVITLVDYRRLREAAPVLYGAVIILLVLVVSPLGTEVNGSQSWFALGSFQLQPAEFAKLAVIFLLAAYCGSRDGLRPRDLAVCLAIVGLPAALIFAQPDLGSVLVFLAIAMGGLLVGGARPRHIVALSVLGMLGTVAAFQLDFIEDYQRERLLVFTSEGEVDPDSAGYNLNQAKTAIANGGLTGRGVFEGTQTKLGYVPEQQTDFIFTVVGEELGFAGSATLLALYGVMGWRIWRAAALARDFFGTLVCVGVLSMLVFQVFENVGMAMGIMPITGIPLPLVSYGGSSAIATFAAIGLVLNVHMRRFS